MLLFSFKIDEKGWRSLKTTLWLLVIFAFCLYLPALSLGLVFDDHIYLKFTNKMIRSLPWNELHQFLLEPANPWEFLPLRDFTYWLDLRIYDNEVFGLHATNLLWYALASFTVWHLFRELILFSKPDSVEKASFWALCGTVFFLIHPAHIEAVVWVASRKDLMAGTFGFASVAFLLYAIRRGWRPVYLILGCLFFLASCFSKSTGITWLIMILAVIFAAWKQSAEISFSRKLLPLLCMGLIAIGSAYVHMHVGESLGIKIENHPGGFAVIERASRILASLFSMLFLPYPQSLYHDVYALGNWHWLISLMLSIAFLTVFFRISKPELWKFGVILLIAPILVYLQIIPFTTWSMASERFVFVSVAGLGLLFIEVASRIKQPSRILALILVLYIPSGVIVWTRITDWEYESTLRQAEYVANPLFHNVMRDKVLYDLLPRGEYTEARLLADQIKRDYAKNALYAMIEVNRAYQSLQKTNQKDENDTKQFCIAIRRLKDSLENGFVKIRCETDISYNNFLRSLQLQLDTNYSKKNKICKAMTP